MTAAPTALLLAVCAGVTGWAACERLRALPRRRSPAPGRHRIPQTPPPGTPPPGGGSPASPTRSLPPGDDMDEHGIGARQHPQAGLTMQLRRPTQLPGSDEAVTTVHVDDWAERVLGPGWMTAAGNPVSLAYAARAYATGLPLDDQVVYVTADGGRSHLVHASELAPAREGHA